MMRSVLFLCLMGLLTVPAFNQNLNTQLIDAAKKGKKWAAKYLLRVNQLNSKKEYEDKIPLSEEDKQNRRELMNIQLSGQKKMVNTMCPHCKKAHAEALEVEYANSPFAWKSTKGSFIMVLCAGCRR